MGKASQWDTQHTLELPTHIRVRWLTSPFLNFLATSVQVSFETKTFVFVIGVFVFLSLRRNGRFVSKKTDNLRQEVGCEFRQYLGFEAYF